VRAPVWTVLLALVVFIAVVAAAAALPACVFPGGMKAVLPASGGVPVLEAGVWDDWAFGDGPVPHGHDDSADKLFDAFGILVLVVLYAIRLWRGGV